MAELFQTTKQNISFHIQNIYNERELSPEATVKEYLTVQKEGNRQVSRIVDFYNLDMIISVGYRIKSHVATRFRQWATQRWLINLQFGKAGDAYPSAGINKRQGKALDLLMKKDLMHVSGPEEICPKVTRRTLQRDLNNLIELNFI